MNTLFSLEGKKALVTGAGRGIGQAIAQALAQSGADVALASRSEAELRETADLVEQVGRKAAVVQADLSVSGAAEQAVAQAASALGGLDILVTSSGRNVRKTALDHNEDDWNAVLDLNLKARFFLSQAAAKTMRDAGKGGSIIHIASLSSFFGIPNHIAYTIGNGGLASMTRAEAVEWAQFNIRVNAIAPGTIVTKLTSNLLNNPDALATRLSKIPMNRLGKPEDIAGTAVFLASDAAAYITGVILPVDGGWLAGGSGWRN
ncbi:MAG TPA: glucose 1-dehydrogenase [Phototrophicaceae bacterium]|nr:glucose 1-dehydrogenase [Phototrophicaceae bacterium]